MLESGVGWPDLSSVPTHGYPPYRWMATGARLRRWVRSLISAFAAVVNRDGARLRSQREGPVGDAGSWGPQSGRRYLGSEDVSL